MIDDEIAHMIPRILEGAEISAETIMPEVMARVGTIGNYLGERETRRRVRSGEVSSRRSPTAGPTNTRRPRVATNWMWPRRARTSSSPQGRHGDRSSTIASA